ISSYVSSRASCYVAAAVHALWQLRNDSEGISSARMVPTTIGYNGSVLEQYPGYLERCQRELELLVTAELKEKSTDVVKLRPIVESSLFGAAVAVAIGSEFGT